MKWPKEKQIQTSAPLCHCLKWEGQEWESQKLKRKTKGRLEKMHPAKTETSVDFFSR